MAYDIKFKQRVLEYRGEGHTFKDTCKTFKISETSLIKWMEKEKEGKLEEVKVRVRKPKKICPEKLVEYINKKPDAYLIEISEEFDCSTTAVIKALKKLKITRKKRPLHTKNNVLKK
ncbi:IS630 transposase-related protein [Romboutsia sp.]|uniref:IS630 transposase-related protein n=1 Tax=Romboutsia sp. TaxID=1965302 RepID=UPI003F379CEF